MKKLEEEAKKFMQLHNKSMMTADEYQRKARETAIYPKKEALPYLSLGLVSEAGEVAGKVKKLIRDGPENRPPTWREDISYEIGDVLWYCSELAGNINYTLGMIAAQNLIKLDKRKVKGTLGGSGDTR